MIEGTVNISGVHSSVIPIVTTSFVFKASDKNYHAVLINLNDDGSYITKVDGVSDSKYIRESKNSPEYKEKIKELAQKLHNAYQKVEDSYFAMYKHLDIVLNTESTTNNMKSLVYKSYQRPTFPYPKPTKQNTEIDLRNEYFASSNQHLDADTFVDRYTLEVLKARENRYTQLVDYYNTIQDTLEFIFNEKQRKLYNAKIGNYKKILEGDEEYVRDTIVSMSDTFELPFMTDLDFKYDKEKGWLSVEIVVPQYLSCPRQKSTLTDDGIIISNKSKEERQKDILVSLRASIIYIACAFFNITTRIHTIELTLWYRSKVKGLGWFRFTRNDFVNIPIRELNPHLLCEKSFHIFKVHNFLLTTFDLQEFKRLIGNKKYQIICDAIHDDNKVMVPLEDINFLLKRENSFSNGSYVKVQADLANHLNAHIVYVDKNVIELIDKEKKQYEIEEAKRREEEIKKHKEEIRKQEEIKRKLEANANERRYEEYWQEQDPFS